MDTLYAIPATPENLDRLKDALARAVAGMEDILHRARRSGTISVASLTVPARFEIQPDYEVMVTVTVHAPQRLPERTREIQSLRALNNDATTSVLTKKEETYHE